MMDAIAPYPPAHAPGSQDLALATPDPDPRTPEMAKSGGGGGILGWVGSAKCHILTPFWDVFLALFSGPDKKPQGSPPWLFWDPPKMGRKTSKMAEKWGP